MSSKFWELYGWIKRGRQRKNVFIQLSDTPVTAEEFRKGINQESKSVPKLSLREVSRHFTSFSKKGLMECLTPDEPYGRLYRLNKSGIKLQKHVIKSIED